MCTVRNGDYLPNKFQKSVNLDELQQVGDFMLEASGAKVWLVLINSPCANLVEALLAQNS